MDLQGKIAMVTGAASGRHTSIALAKEGSDVVMADLDRDGLAEVCSEIETMGRRGLAVPTDVTKLEKTALDDWKWDVLYGTYVFLLTCWIVAAGISSTPLLLPGW